MIIQGRSVEMRKQELISYKRYICLYILIYYNYYIMINIRYPTHTYVMNLFILRLLSLSLSLFRFSLFAFFSFLAIHTHTHIFFYYNMRIMKLYLILFYFSKEQYFLSSYRTNEKKIYKFLSSHSKPIWCVFVCAHYLQII